MSKSITQLRKWNLVAGGSDPRNDVIPASVGYGLEDALDFAMSEITRLEDRCKRLQDAGDASECSKLKRELNAANDRIMLLEEAGIVAIHEAVHGREDDALEIWRKAMEAKP